VQITTKTISVAAATLAALALALASASAADCQDKVSLLKACVRKD